MVADAAGVRVSGLMRSLAGFSCITLLASHDAMAQPRLPTPPWVDPVGPPVEPDVWLRRLVGRYSFDGMVHVVSLGDCAPLPPENGAVAPPFNPACETVSGKGDCVGIGSGPGVQCVLNLAWNPFHTPQGPVDLPGAVPYLSPAMGLFGLDPGNAALNYLLVDNKGLPEGGPGANTGNRATFKTLCVNEPGADRCHRTLRIEAKPDARLLYMWIDVEIENDGSKELVTSIMLSLRRIPEGNIDMAASKSSGDEN